MARVASTALQIALILASASLEAKCSLLIKRNADQISELLSCIKGHLFAAIVE